MNDAVTPLGPDASKPRIRVVEVGPRDGLQNEARVLPLQAKLQFIDSLVAAGCQQVEVGAFVRPDRIPQMVDSEKIFQYLQDKSLLDRKDLEFWCLVPNEVGLERALLSRARHLAFFTAATDSFARHNMGMSVEDSLRLFPKLIKQARDVAGPSVRIRGYVSTAWGCPYEGEVAPIRVLRVVGMLFQMGVDQVSVADTIGVASPKSVERLLREALALFPAHSLAVHFHDTRGTALANALRALELGITTFDTAAGGLGGCPYAPGASGNLATEDFLYMVHEMGYETGVDIHKICESSAALMKELNRPASSKYLQAFLSDRSFAWPTLPTSV